MNPIVSNNNHQAKNKTTTEERTHKKKFQTKVSRTIFFIPTNNTMNSMRRNSLLTVDGINYDISNLFPTPSDHKEIVAESMKLKRYATDSSYPSPSSSSLFCSSNNNSSGSSSNSSKKSTTNTRPTYHRSSSSRRRLLEKSPGSIVGSSRRHTTVIASSQQQMAHSPIRSKSYKVSATGTSSSRRVGQHSTTTTTTTGNLKQPPSYSLAESSSNLYPSSVLSQCPSDDHSLSKYTHDSSSFDIRERQQQQNDITTNTCSISPSTSTDTKADHDEKPMIEIEPGIYEPLRGSKETAAAVSQGFLIDVQCLCCTKTVRCIEDAKYFLCPLCKVVAPITQQKQQERGVVESNHRRSSGYVDMCGYVDMGFGNTGGACDRTSILFLSDDEDRCGISSSSSLSQQKKSHDSSPRWGVGLGFLIHCD